MEARLFIEAICPKCHKTNFITQDYISVYQHEWDEYDSEMRCEATLKCSCGYKEDFEIPIY